MSPQAPLSLQSFLKLEVDADEFGHRRHLEMAYQILQRFHFNEASTKYAATIKALTEKLGVPEKYHATITFCYISLVAERLTQNDYCNFDEFLQANGDLMNKTLLNEWYSPQRLSSQTAKQQFVLPDISPIRVI